DPGLTQKGISQACAVHTLWKTELQHGLPLPDRLYCSPLTRAIQTNRLTFDGIIPDERRTTIVENTRECVGIHTCDKRRTRTYIVRTFPEYLVEDGFTEDDQLWKPDVRETWSDLDLRVNTVLDMIFRNDEEQFISITTHAGFIRAFLRVTGHAPWRLPPGGVLPMVVKASEVAQYVSLN
ncbi:hypothetical protein ID866_11119, partial [Astraeus odoratus]